LQDLRSLHTRSVQQPDRIPEQQGHRNAQIRLDNGTRCKIRGVPGRAARCMHESTVHNSTKLATQHPVHGCTGKRVCIRNCVIRTRAGTHSIAITFSTVRSEKCQVAKEVCNDHYNKLILTAVHSFATRVHLFSVKEFRSSDLWVRCVAPMCIVTALSLLARQVHYIATHATCSRTTSLLGWGLG
jgi:hypothetical protein